MANKETTREMEEAWALRRDAVRILGVVAGRWNTDPESTKGFDPKIVVRAIEVTDRLAVLSQRNPFV